jgi:hypothetical protein
MAIASSTDDDPAGLTVVQIGNLSADGDGNIERMASIRIRNQQVRGSTPRASFFFPTRNHRLARGLATPNA